jgi:hypothetical protein
MSSHSKALDKKEKHKHKKGADEKCIHCGKVMDMVDGNEGKVDDKGKKPKKEFGAKNNDSEED